MGSCDVPLRVNTNRAEKLKTKSNRVDLVCVCVFILHTSLTERPTGSTHIVIGACFMCGADPYTYRAERNSSRALQTQQRGAEGYHLVPCCMRSSHTRKIYIKKTLENLCRTLDLPIKFSACWKWSQIKQTRLNCPN